MSGLGEMLQKKRRQMKMSVEHLAEAIGVSVGTIRAVEQGRRNPSAKTLSKLLETLEIESGIWLDDWTWQSSGGETYELARFSGDNRRRPPTDANQLRVEVIAQILWADSATLSSIQQLLSR